MTTFALLDLLSENFGSHLISPLIGISLACLFIGALLSMRQNRRLREKTTVYVPSGVVSSTEEPALEAPAGLILKEQVFNPAELTLFQTVSACLPAHAIGLYGQRLMDLMDPDAGVHAGGALLRERLDGVICNARSGAVMGVILLTDSRAHSPALDRALAAAGIPVLHLQSQRLWSSGQISYLLREGLGIASGEPEPLYSIIGAV